MILLAFMHVPVSVEVRGLISMNKSGRFKIIWIIFVPPKKLVAWFALNIS